MITEHLMRPGTGALRLRSNTPPSVTEQIRSLFNGVGCHVVITSVPVDPLAIGDAATLAAAQHTMRVTGRVSRTTLALKGLSSWLDSNNDVEISRSVLAPGTPTQWLGDLLVNGLTTGVVSGGSSVARTFPAWGQFRREALDVVAGLGGWEYEVRPDFTVNAGTSVWSTTPTVVITDRDEGFDGTLTGLAGDLLDQETVEEWATKAGALAQGDGPGIAVGQATKTVPLKDRNGNTPVLVTTISAPSEQRGNETTLATNYLNLRGLRRAVKVSTTTPHARRVLRPGDYVWLWDQFTGLVDDITGINQVFYRGEWITPLKVRVTSMSSPIEAGSGVYIRPNAASPEYIDVTDYVAWEPPGTFMEVGEWSPPVYGRANRNDPEVEARIGAVTPWNTATLQNSWVAFDASRTLQYRKIGDLVYLQGAIKNGTATAGTVLANLPAGFRPVLPGVSFPVSSSTLPARIDIGSGGDITIQAGGNTFLFVDGVFFQAAP